MEELRVLARKLDTPQKIQDFINTIGPRKDEEEPIVRSPVAVLEYNEATCVEGALLVAALFYLQNKKSLLLDLRVGSKTNDVDHVVALFRSHRRWGALSKTSHSVLRYREPVYKNIRELAMSYFHEYFTDDGAKNLRGFSKPFDVVATFGTSWIDSKDDLAEIAAHLDDIPHEDVMTKRMEKKLRKADPIEIQAGLLEE